MNVDDPPLTPAVPMAALEPGSTWRHKSGREYGLACPHRMKNLIQLGELLLRVGRAGDALAFLEKT